MSTPELEPVRLDADHQARVDKRLADNNALHRAAMEALLHDAMAAMRRIGAETGVSRDPSVYGDHCINCEERWALPADKASCAHKPICEDCWPNGCQFCEAEVEAGIRRREELAHRITTAALELRTGADDLSEADMARLDWRVRNDIVRHVDLTIEALRRVRDNLNAQAQR